VYVPDEPPRPDGIVTLAAGPEPPEGFEPDGFDMPPEDFAAGCLCPEVDPPDLEVGDVGLMAMADLRGYDRRIVT